jgi:hypothetical protein
VRHLLDRGPERIGQPFQIVPVSLRGGQKAP